MSIKKFYVICMIAMAIVMQSCSDHKNENASNMFIGEWEISSKDDVEEDGTSLEHILELKTGNVFTETYTFYDNGEKTAVVSIEGEFGVEATVDAGKKNQSIADGYTLWRKYNIDSINIEADGDHSELMDMFEEKFTNENNELEKARKEGQVYGLPNVRNEGDLTWETDELINEQYPDMKKRAKAKRILNNWTRIIIFLIVLAITIIILVVGVFNLDLPKWEKRIVIVVICIPVVLLQKFFLKGNDDDDEEEE